MANNEITLEEIRAGLLQGGGTGLLQSGAAPSKKQFDDTKTVTTATVLKQLKFAFELLELVRLLEAAQAEKALEWEEKTMIVRQFEDLNDAVRMRQRQLPTKVREIQEKFALRKQKCENLVVRAQKHISSAQHDRDRGAMDAVSVKQKIDDLEDTLQELRAFSEEQQAELEAARIKAQKVPSEREMMELQLKLRRLQNDNAQLLTDINVLRAAVDDSPSQKNVTSGSSTNASIATLLSSVRTDENRYGVVAEEKIKQLRKQIAKLKKQYEAEGTSPLLIKHS